MAARRSAGEGSIFQDKNGRWVAMIELPRHPNGRRHRKLRRGRTRAEAQRKLAEMKAEIVELGSLAFNARTVAEMMDGYQQVWMARSPSRSDRQRNELFAQTILVFFGDSRKLGEITVPECDRLLADFGDGSISPSGQPVSREYCGRLRSFLSNAFQNEIRQGHLKHNPASNAIIPATTVAKRNKRALSASEWQALYRSAEGVTKLIVDLGGRHGLRPQELRALRWSAVDREQGTLSVDNQFDSDDEFVDPKTVKSSRTIRLHPDTAVLLDAWRATQGDNRGHAGDRWSDQNLIVCTSVGSAIQKSNLQRMLTALCERAKIGRITSYELRHTAITHQIEAGNSASQVADWAGTSERMIYNHYRHKLREVNELLPLDYDSSGATE